jgi:hypothetical protein
VPIAKIFCTAFGTVLFLYQGKRVLAETECHCWQAAVHLSSGLIRNTHQAIPTQAMREPAYVDAESIAQMVARKAGSY